MTTVDNRVASLVGTFLSAYDETALEGVERLSKLCSSTANDDPDVVHAFLADAAAVDAFMALFARPKLNLAPVFTALAQLLRTARKPSCALLMRLLLGPGPRQRVRDAVNRLSDQTLPTTVAGLRLMATAVELNAKQTVAKLSRTVPLQSNAFVETPPMSQQAVRPARVELMLAFLRAKHPDVVAAAATQHGVLTRLCEDACELLKRGDGQYVDLVRSAIDAVGSAFAGNPDLSSAQKRTLLNGQRGVTRALTTLLAWRSVAEQVAVVLRRIVEEVAEPSRDYAVLRDADDSRMPNFVLFVLLRNLRPKHRALDAHLVVFVLHRCPDLCRPYLTRVARRLPEYDGTLSIPRASVAVCNTLTRLFLCPLPEYIASGSARLLEPTAKHNSFFDLTPEAAADEVVPAWFREAAHRHIGANEGSAMMLVFLLQCMQGAVNRAAKVKAALERLAAAQCAAHRAAASEVSAGATDHTAALASILATGADGRITTAADAATFLSQFDATVQERLPRREVLLPHIANAVRKCTESTVGETTGVATAADTKEAFVMQRAALYLHSAAAVFGWRTSFGVVLPTPTQPWSPECGGAVALRSMNGTSIRTMCLLIISNLSRQVKVAKLLHVQLAGADAAKADAQGKGGKAKDRKDGKKNKQAAAGDQADGAIAGEAASPLAPPLLMELLYWAIAARDRAATAGVVDFAALRAVARLVQWGVRAAVPGAHVALDEVALWLRYLTFDTATLLVHAINHAAMLLPRAQQALLSSVEEADACGSLLAAMATAFVAKQREKAEAAGGATASPWIAHIRANLDGFDALVAKIVKRWPKRAAALDEMLRCEPEQSASGDAGAAAPSAAAAVQPTQEAQALLLRHAKSSTGSASDHHTPVITFFSRFVLPAPVANAANEMGELATAAAATPSADALGRAVAAAANASHKYAAWFLAVPCARLAHQVSLGTRVCMDAAQTTALTSASARAAERVSGDDELSATGAAVLAFSVARLIAMTAAPLREDARAGFVTAALGLYTGSLGARDRVLFAALALVEHTPAAASRSESSSSAPSGGASDDDDGSGDDSDSDEHPAVKSSSILGPRPKKRGPRGEAEVRGNNGAAAEAASAARRKSPAVLRALREARFLVGGASCLESLTPEVEALTSLVEGLTDRELVFAALRAPLRIATPTPEEAGRPPLRLIFPDVADRQRKRTARWFEQRAAASGSVEPYDSDPVSTAVVDPRYLMPLFHAVSALRFRHAVNVNATAVLRLAPLAVRMLSALDSPLRQAALGCLALMYRRLHPLPRLVVNAVRLLLQKQIDPSRLRPDGAPPRLLAVHSAHLALAFHPVGHFAHPLHERVTESLNLQDETVVPLDEMLADFPASAVTGVPRADRPTELATTPHLRHVVEQLARSCASWQDYAFLQRRNIVGMLCLDASLLRHDAALRSLVLGALRAVCLCHAEDVAVHAAVQDHVVAWLLTSLEEVADPSDAAGSEEMAAELLALLRAVYPYFRTANLHHRRSAAVVLGTLRFAHVQRVLSRPLLIEGLSVVEMAQRMGGAPAGVLAAADERGFVRELLNALDDCGATLTIGHGSTIHDALRRLRGICASA